MELPAIGSYDFLAPRQIIFGWGRWSEVGRHAASVGDRAFLVVGSRTLASCGFVAQLCELLAQHGVKPIELATITREPEADDVDLAAERIRSLGPRQDDLVLGVGGGSAIDLAKGVAAMATNLAGSSVRDYLEGVGRGLSLTAPPLSVVAMPTTGGTGSEATKNAVISSYDPPFKKSLRADRLMPRLVVVDPALSVTVPPDVTARTGMDAITQLIESYISRKARPIAQALALAGLRAALPAVVEAVESPESRPAREAMAHAALLSGMALANSGLGMAHGVAAALGVHHQVPHGLACAVMLGVALRTNREVARRQLSELAECAGVASAASPQAADKFIERIDEIADRLRIPRRLSRLGVKASHLADLVRDSRGNSMDGNPRSLSDEELARILEADL